jgi:hypothetical protein
LTHGNALFFGNGAHPGVKSRRLLTFALQVLQKPVLQKSAPFVIQPLPSCHRPDTGARRGSSAIVASVDHQIEKEQRKNRQIVHKRSLFVKVRALSPVEFYWKGPDYDRPGH